MIISFGKTETEQVWLGNRVIKLSTDIQNTGRRKLRMLNNSVDLADLRIPPSNRLEKLSGNQKKFIVPGLITIGELFLNGMLEMPMKLK